MMRPSKTTIALLALLAAAAIGNGIVGGAMEKYRDRRAVEPGEFTGTVLLAAFRPAVKSWLWTRALTLIGERKYFEVKPILEELARVEPHFPEAHFFNAQVLAFDMTFFAKTREVKWRWISEGYHYAERGARLNPDDPNLPLLAGEILYRKIAANPARDDARYFLEMFRRNHALNPDGHAILDVIRDWAERSRAVPSHPVYTETLLDVVFRTYEREARSRGDSGAARKALEDRLDLWRSFKPPNGVWREKREKRIESIRKALKTPGR